MGSIANETEKPASKGPSVRIGGLTVNGFINESTGVANFLNIQFARVHSRFSQATLINPKDEVGTIEATSYGPRCPQPYDKFHERTTYLYEEMSTDCPQSEFECLNLNIYTPPRQLEITQKIPVVVWIHGGAYTYGDNGCEYDGNYLVRRAAELGKPIVVVAINYRLGYFGFLSSKELKDEARKRGEIGFSNLGLHDQRLGIQWIQNNIYAFGGDGEYLTGTGESAGAFSVISHLASDFPAFRHAFILSCPPPALQSAEQHQATFDRLVSSTGLSASAPAGDKIAALRSLSTEQIHSLLNGGIATPGWDENFFTNQSVQDAVSLRDGFPSWIKLAVVGHTRDEIALFANAWKKASREKLLQDLRELFPDPAFTEEVLKIYSVTDTSTQQELVDAYIRLVTDSSFSKAAYDICRQGNESPLCVYSFDQEDLLGDFKGFAYHSLDNPFLFLLPHISGAKAPSAWKVTAELFAKSLVDVAYGKEPWERYDVAERAMAFNGERTGLTKDSNFKRWLPLISTAEREKMFANATQLLFRAMLDKPA